MKSPLSKWKVSTPHQVTRKKGGQFTPRGATSRWLHGNSIPKIGCPYFWPGLITFAKNTLPIVVLLILHPFHMEMGRATIPLGGDEFYQSSCFSDPSLFTFLWANFHISQPEKMIWTHTMDFVKKVTNIFNSQISTIEIQYVTKNIKNFLNFYFHI
jgi:hypothetical protein